MHATNKDLRYAQQKEIDHIIIMTPIYVEAAQRAKLQYDRTQKGEDFVTFLDAHYRTVCMKDKLALLSRLLEEVPA